MNTNDVAAILIKAHAEFSNVKRNSSGTPNGNAVNTVWKRTRKALIEVGETEGDAQSMVYDLCKRTLPGHLN